MNEQEVRKKVEQAKRIVGGDPTDPFTHIAFEVVFRKLLEERESTEQIKRPPPAISKMQINELLASKNLKSHMDKVEAIAWHFLHQAGESCVTRKDILDAYSKARVPKPKNLTDVINQSVSAKRAHLTEALKKKNGQKAWQITPTGEKYIEEQLQITQQ